MAENGEKSKINKALDNEEKVDLSVSYSKLSDFDRNGATSLVRKSNPQNDGLKLGSLVDDLLFLDKKKFNDLYYRFDGNKPTATLGVLCDIIIKNYVRIPTTTEVIKIIRDNNLWGNIKEPATLVAKFNNDEFWNYLDCMYKSVNKTVITNKDYSDATELVEILKSHKYSKNILDNDMDNYYQVKFEYDYRGFKVRGIIDILIIDHKNRRIFMTDLKTGKNPSSEFETSFIKWRYYFQGALYMLAYDEICKELGLKDYVLEPFQFLYISKSDKVPLLFKMTNKWVDASFNGFNINKYKYRGINELLDEIYWCWKNKEYVIPKYIADNNGIVELKDNFIEVNE